MDRLAAECHFRMATFSRRLSEYSFQETQNTACHNTLQPNCFPLSKSSSATLFPRWDSTEGRQTTKQELRKTLSSVAPPRNPGEMDMRCPYHPSCFTPQDNFTVIPLCRCFHMGTIPDPNNVSEFPVFQDDSKTHAHMSAIHSMRKGTDAMLYTDSNLGKLQTKMMHRSCSDIICGYKETCDRGSAVYNNTHQATVPGRDYGMVPQGELMTQACSQKIVINISGSETDTGYQENLRESTTIDGHQDNNITNDMCSSMHQGHLMFTKSPPNHPGVPVVQESSGQYQGNSLTRSETGPTGGVTYREGVATHQNSLMGNQTCTGLQSHLLSGLRMQDTTPAYCHSLPIPAIHLFPRLVSSVSESGRGNVVDACCHPLPVSGILTFPRLVSSVSETGLDARHLLKCHGNVEHEAVHMGMCDRNAQNTPDGGNAEVETFPLSLLQNNSNNNVGVQTRDTWTMTSITDLTLRYYRQLDCKDAAVQTSLAGDCRSVGTSPMSPTDSRLVHMFPEVNLEESQLIQESPVREVKWDDQGMTWEVYGASVDPEVLGLAIQKHLEIQIEQHEKDRISTAEKTVQQLGTPAEGSCVADQPAEEKRHLPGFRNMLSTLRHPTCCVRSSTALD
ncbi:uncharacterized protein LOC119956017 isoform X1 [Scyliorhinus canicula]|uniref:uncharacterized protein LOC119956017 isoform X1 n=2 Tax=Scyliorhinus canicula TaxID=7830 RepID=UPI0018F38C20|nr:uncharacterized protein LOC119956017 isoform X1 [Scyliorhinus canicula]